MGSCGLPGIERSEQAAWPRWSASHLHEGSRYIQLLEHCCDLGPAAVHDDGVHSTLRRTAANSRRRVSNAESMSFGKRVERATCTRGYSHRCATGVTAPTSLEHTGECDQIPPAQAALTVGSTPVIDDISHAVTRPDGCSWRRSRHIVRHFILLAAVIPTSSPLRGAPSFSSRLASRYLHRASTWPMTSRGMRNPPTDIPSTVRIHMAIRTTHVFTLGDKIGMTTEGEW